MTRRSLPAVVAGAPQAAGAAVVALSLVRPRGQAAPAGATVLRTAISEPSSLDPARASTASDYAVVTRVFSRLVECDAALDLRPSLARTWTVSPDGRTYRFRLARARFHDGREVEAKDVAGTLTRLLAADTGGSYPEMLSVVTGARERRLGQAKDVSGIRVLGRHEIEIRLDEPYAPFLSLLSAPALSIVPAEEAERAGASFGRAPQGSGPFRFERWEASRAITLQAHDGAPEGRPPVDALSFVLMPQTSAARVQELLAQGSLDYVLAPPGPPPAVAGYEVRSHPELAVFYFGFNVGAGPAMDARLRRAFRLGIDRRAFAQGMLIDPSMVTDSIIPSGFRRSMRPVPAPDFEAARALFTELSVSGRRPRLRLNYTASRQELQDAFAALAEHFAGLGLDLELNRLPSFNELRALQDEGKFEAWFGGAQADTPDPDGFVRGLFHSRERGSNWFRFNSKTMDELLDRSRRTGAPGERARVFAEIDDLIALESPAVPVWNRNYRYYVASHVQGLELSYSPYTFPLGKLRLLPKEPLP
jgi:ABC-type transport system substrate-binding protein